MYSRHGAERIVHRHRHIPARHDADNNTDTDLAAPVKPASHDDPSPGFLTLVNRIGRQLEVYAGIPEELVPATPGRSTSPATGVTVTPRADERRTERSLKV